MLAFASRAENQRDRKNAADSHRDFRENAHWNLRKRSFFEIFPHRQYQRRVPPRFQGTRCEYQARNSWTKQFFCDIQAKKQENVSIFKISRLISISQATPSIKKRFPSATRWISCKPRPGFSTKTAHRSSLAMKTRVFSPRRKKPRFP